MNLNLVGPFIVNAPFATEIAFTKGLRRIGVTVNEVDPNIDKTLDGLDQTADATIVFKNCVGNEQHLRRLKGPVIVYQPDDARFSHIREMMIRMRPYSDLLLSFDDYGAQVALTMGYRASQTLLLTADDELYCPSEREIERDIDVSFIGSLGDPVAHASRRRMIQLVSEWAAEHGWKTFFGQTQNMDTILDVYRRSKVVLNHATDVGQEFGWGFGLQCRHFEVAMTRTCLASNFIVGRTPDKYPWLGEQFLNEGTLFGSLYSLLNDVRGKPDEAAGTPSWKFYAQQGYDAVMASHKPEHRAAQLVDFIKRNT